MIGMNLLGQNGRLGNQLFQYAALVGIAKNMGYDYCIPDHSQATWFDKTDANGNTTTVYHQLQHLFEMNYLNGRFGLIENGNDVNLQQAEFCEELFNGCPDNSTLYGYFESYKYFENVEDELRSDFIFKDQILSAAQKFHDDSQFDHPVAINVRRGDFIRVQDHHPPCSEAYYKEAIGKMGDNRQYLVISDDIEWCKSIFIGSNFTFNETVPDGIIKGHFDLAVGALCSDFIISNSTFSWWMAYLGSNNICYQNKIYAPTPWFGAALSHIDTEGYYPPYFEKIEREIVRV